MHHQTRLVDVPAAQRFMKFDKIEWHKAFFKTYFERRSFLHLLVNFNRIWVLHISIFWMYTSYNSPTIYRGKHTNPPPAVTWTVVALGGGVASLIMIAATLAEFSYVPTTWNNTSHLMRRLVFLLVVFALTAGPSVYILFFSQESKIARIIGIVQFGISVAAVVIFATVPSGRLFGDRVAGKSRKYLASQTFTASYPKLSTRARLASIGLWVLVFGCKLTESYFFLTLSFENPIRVMVGMKVQNCSDKIFGTALCMNQPAFALAIMFCMDLCLFFLDTFLWYVIWNTGQSTSLQLLDLRELILGSILLRFSLPVQYFLSLAHSPSVCPFGHHGKTFSNVYQNEFTPKCLRQQTWKSSTSPRCSSVKSGTPLSSRCTESIYSLSTTFSGYYIIKFPPSKTESVRCEPQCSSSLKMIRFVFNFVIMY